MENVSKPITVCVTVGQKSRILHLPAPRVALLKENIREDPILSTVVGDNAFTLRIQSERFHRQCEIADDDLLDDGSEIILIMV